MSMWVPSQLSFLTSMRSQTAIYAQGVGLGASKGKDIENLAGGGYSGYQMAQETVGGWSLYCMVGSDAIATGKGAL